jgi:NAD(P) transhydrogenase subunit alpha
MMMTAAGTVPAARIFIMGVGVAGLQAIATARRMGAIVTATDVRPATKEQVESLGAKFLAVEDDEFKQARRPAATPRKCRQGISGQAGRADGEPHRQAGHRHHHRADPGPSGAEADLGRDGREHEAGLGDRRSRGRARRQLRTRQARRGRGDAQRRQDRRPSQRARPLAATSSQLYAKNLFAFVETLIDKNAKTLAVNWDDELVKATALTKDGAVVHPNFAPKPAPEPAPVVEGSVQNGYSDTRTGARAGPLRRRCSAQQAAELAEKYAEQAAAAAASRQASIRPSSASRSSCSRSSSAITWSGR